MQNIKNMMTFPDDGMQKILNKHFKFYYLKCSKGTLYHISFSFNTCYNSTQYVFNGCAGYMYTRVFDFQKTEFEGSVCKYCLYRLRLFIRYFERYNKCLNAYYYKIAAFRCNMTIKNKKSKRLCSRHTEKCNSFCKQHTKSLENVFINYTSFSKDIYKTIIHKML